MLGKLLKYDLKWNYKLLGVFYLLSIFFCLVTRGINALGNHSTIFQILGTIFSIITYAIIANVIVNTFTRAIVRFIRNVYKDESYLTHTLPVERKQVYLSKYVSGLICMFTSTVVVVISLFILFYSKENMEAIKMSLQMAADAYNSSVISVILLISATVFLQMATILMIAYTSIILGHRAEEKRILKSLLWGLGLYFVTQMTVLLFIFIVGIGNANMMELFTSNSLPSADVIKFVMWDAIIINVLCIIVYYLIGKRKLAKGVNVD